MSDTDESARRVTHALLLSDEEREQDPPAEYGAELAMPTKLWRVTAVWLGPTADGRDSVYTMVAFGREAHTVLRRAYDRFPRTDWSCVVEELSLDQDKIEVRPVHAHEAEAHRHRRSNLARFAQTYAATGSTTAAKAAIGGGK